MQHENNKHNESAAGKSAPHNVSGNTEEQARQKTEPLEPHELQREDQREGNMDNGELGANLSDKD